MTGNVWEWVSDWYSETYYGTSPGSNPKGPETGTNKVLRGGSWIYANFGLRCAGRDADKQAFTRHSNIGFRCAR